MPVLIPSGQFQKISEFDELPPPGVVFSLAKFPQPPNDQSSQIWVVRVKFANHQQVADIAAWTEPWEVNFQEGFVVVGVSQTEYLRLLAQGYSVEIDHQYTHVINQPFFNLPNQISGIPGYDCYRTVEETAYTAQDIVSRFPSLAEWIDIGDSWEKSNPDGLPGYDLMVLKLTNASITEQKPKLFIMAAVHPRELATAELNSRFAEHLTRNYGIDPDITWILDYSEIHLLLVANPDGRKQAEAGLLWRKNTNQNYCSPISNNRGADLNRNFSFQWGCCGGSSGSQCDDTFRGPSSASEPETQAIQNYLRSIFPDQRGDKLSDAVPEDAMGIFLDLHSYGEQVLWPWGFTNTEPPNSSALQTLGRKFAFFNDYEPYQAIALYPTDGTTEDFAYGDLGLAAYTFELGKSFFENCQVFENLILPNNLPALLYAAKAARSPYKIPSGPETVEVDSIPDHAVHGRNVTLVATINDTLYSEKNGLEPSQNITAAEFTIDLPPWETGANSYPLSAVDGSFDSSIESVHAVIDTDNLAVGRHIIFIHGQDAAGHWGAVSSQFLTIHASEIFLPFTIVDK